MCFVWQRPLARCRLGCHVPVLTDAMEKAAVPCPDCREGYSRPAGEMTPENRVALGDHARTGQIGPETDSAILTGSPALFQAADAKKGQRYCIHALSVKVMRLYVWNVHTGNSPSRGAIAKKKGSRNKTKTRSSFTHFKHV